MDVIPIIVSTVLLVILVPTVAYIFVSTPTKADFIEHERADDDNMREIRAALAALSVKIDENFRATMTLYRNGGNK